MFPDCWTFSFADSAGNLLQLFADQLKDHFSSYGTIVDVVIMQDHTTGRSRGFGFLTFDNEAVVDTILTSNKVHEIDGKQVSLVVLPFMLSGIRHRSRATSM